MVINEWAIRMILNPCLSNSDYSIVEPHIIQVVPTANITEEAANN